MIKRVLSLVIFLLLANAGVRVGMRLLPSISSSRTRLPSSSLFSGEQNRGDRQGEGDGARAPRTRSRSIPTSSRSRRKNVPGSAITSAIKVSYAVNVKVLPPPGKPRRFEFDYTTR